MGKYIKSLIIGKQNEQLNIKVLEANLGLYLFQFNSK